MKKILIVAACSLICTLAAVKPALARTESVCNWNSYFFEVHDGNTDCATYGAAAVCQAIAVRFGCTYGFPYYGEDDNACHDWGQGAGQGSFGWCTLGN